MGFGFDLVDAGTKAYKAALEARDGPSKELIVNKGPGFSMGLPPALQKEKEEREKAEKALESPTIKIDDTTTEITNVVFARDPSIIDPDTQTVE